MSNKGHAATRLYGTTAERAAYDTTQLQLGAMWIATDVDQVWFWDGAEWLWVQETIGCRVFRDANQSINDVTWTAISFDTEIWDSGGFFTPTTSQITPSVAGYYTITGGYDIDSNGVERSIAIRKNGTEWIARVDLDGGSFANVAATMVYMNGSTDYVEIMIYQSSGGAVNLGAGGAGQNSQDTGHGACMLICRN